MKGISVDRIFGRVATSVVVVCGVLAAAGVAHATTITSLGSEPGNPVALNNADQVIGTGSGTTPGTFLWTNGTVTSLQSLPLDSGYTQQGGIGVKAINDSGTIVGTDCEENAADVAKCQITTWSASSGSPTVPAGLQFGDSNGYPPDAFGLSIDNAGDIGGGVLYNASSGTYPAAVYLAHGTSTPTLVSNNPGTGSTGMYGVSGSLDLGLLGGTTYVSNDVVFDAGATDPTATSICGLGTTQEPDQPMASDGTYIGYQWTEATGCTTTPEIVTPGDTPTAVPLGTATNAFVEAVNASHTIVGSTTGLGGSPNRVATMWQAGQGPVDLNTLLPPDSGWVLTGATGINDAGDIVGYGTYNGTAAGWLLKLTPKVPPVVNSTGDAAASDPSSGSCDTGATVANSSGQQVPECTLRAAIQAVDSGNATTTTISFDIPGSALAPVQLGSALPPITADGATIDGTTESAGKLEVLGPGAATGVPSGSVGCLDVQAESVTLTGLYVGGCQVGIELEAPGHDTVSGDVLGLATDGASRLSNNYGVWTSDSPDDTIGAATAAGRDVISDNIRGVVLQGPGSSGDLVQSDLIGTDASGYGFAPNQYGVTVFDADRDTIGSAGVSTGAAGGSPGNVIVAAPGTFTAGAANFAVGVLGVSNPAVDDVVAGNLIGTEASGSEVSPAGGAAVNVALAGSASSDQVANNLIAGASAAQVLVDSVDASQDTVSENLIGSNHAGTAELASSLASGVVVAAANGTQITANAITGQGVGVRIQAQASAFPAGLTGGSVGSSGSGKTQAVVTKNVIGPLGDSSTVPKPAQDLGIFDNTGQQDQIGPGNAISFNELGVVLGRTKDAELYGNKIGTAPGGTAAYPNGLGVVVAHASGTRVGHSAQPNTISGNTAGGVDVLGSKSTEIRSDLIGTTFLGNAAVKSYRGTLPWGDLLNTDEQLPGSLGELQIRGVTGITVYAGSEKTTIGGRGASVVIGGIKGKDAEALELHAKAVVDSARIGVGKNGKTAVANSGDGVAVRGDDADDASIIDSIVAHNKTGFLIADGAKRTLIRFNSVFDNRDGIVDHTEEAPLAPDVGGPHLTTYLHRTVIFLTFTAHLTSLDRGEVDFYATPGCEKGGAGKKEIGVEKVDGGVKDKGKFLFEHFAVGTGITATLTTKPRGTSVFSKCEELKPVPR